MKKILLFVLMLFSSIMVVDATSISNIDMDVFVDMYGNATITETWDAYIDQGTEGWHPYYNLGSSEITDLEVTMDGKEFTTVSDWNIDGSLSDKAYKAGIYYSSNDEVDICFGISDYGNHEYVIKYRISNFVSTIEDADMIYWNLFPNGFSAEPSNVDIRIYSDFRYEDTLDVWGYGKYGAPCYVYDGKIEMTSDGSRVTSDEYMTILVKFPKGTFQTSSVLDNNFNYYYDMAEDGAVNYNDKTSWWEALIPIIVIIFNVLLFGIISALIVNSSRNDKCSFGKTGNKVRKDVPVFRDIPCDKDIFYAYWVAHNYNLTKKKEDFLGAVLLKWIHDGNVRIEKITKDGVFKDKTYSNVIFSNRPDEKNTYEVKLYDYMYQASEDGKLEQNEFKNWCNNNYSKILDWFDDVLYQETLDLVKLGKITYENGKTMKLFSYKYFNVAPSMMEVAEKMAGLKKFLKEFTLIKEREPIEVNLWNEYLMYAQIFGIAEEVADQFKKLYPEIITDMDNIGYDYGDIIFIRSITADGIRSASTAKSRAESYSSGGGGFSSGGGGGGSFGGGGGGGGFR
ncbi:MAG: DUF2207 domain-containing protein [Bacilli bacterium]|nr:DUF2207 domain-containing protein [Bacilli bacterium]